MADNREPEPGAFSTEETEIRRAPRERERDIEDIEIYELEEHEFTLVVDDVEGAASVRDDLTVPWSTMRPVPAWATTARALLDQPTPVKPPETLEAAARVEMLDEDLRALEGLDADSDTRRESKISGTVSEWRALRDEVERGQRQLRELALRLEVTESSLLETRRELALQLGAARGHAFRAAELEQRLRELGGGRVKARATATIAAAPEPGPPAADGGEAEPRVPDELQLPAATRKPRVRARRIAIDDLQLIRGVGRRFAEKLDALGMGTYAAIAAWTVEDIARVGEELGVGAKRIQREAWVKQAQRLETRSERKASRSR